MGKYSKLKSELEELNKEMNHIINGYENLANMHRENARFFESIPERKPSEIKKEIKTRF